MKNDLLAIGIPTYKRPRLVISLIKKIIEIDIYDQIIISSNSHEALIHNFITKTKNNKILFYQQSKNVGVAKNYKKIIELCKCKFLHVISDEDSLNNENVKSFYKFLKNSDDDLIIGSIKSFNGKDYYKDTRWQNNKYLKDVMGEAGHFGSSIINVQNWNKNSFKILDEYCNRKGSIRVSEAACLISYSYKMRLKYFRYHIVEMGKVDQIGEIRGYFAYGLENVIDQFVNLIKLVLDLKLKNKYQIFYYIFYYYAHHAFHNSSKRFNESPTLKIFFYNSSNYYIKFLLYILLVFYYIYFIYYKILAVLNKLNLFK